MVRCDDDDNDDDGVVGNTDVDVILLLMMMMMMMLMMLMLLLMMMMMMMMMMMKMIMIMIMIIMMMMMMMMMMMIFMFLCSCHLLCYSIIHTFYSSIHTGDKGLVSLPVSIPTATSYLHNLLQRQSLNSKSKIKYELIWEDHQYFAYRNDDKDRNDENVYMKYEAVVNSSTALDMKIDSRATTTTAASTMINNTSEVLSMGRSNNNTTTAWRSSVSYKESRYISPEYYPTRHAARQATSELMMRSLDEDHYISYLKLKISVKTVLKQMRRDASQEIRDRLNDSHHHNDDDSDFTDDGDGNRLSVDDFDGRDINVDDNDDDDYEDEKDVHDAFPERLSVIIEDGYKDIDIDIEPNLTLSSQDYEDDDDSTSDVDHDDHDDDDDVVNDGDKDGDNSYPEGNDLVNDDEYLSYLKDSDIEHYLNGLLWVAQMYVDGACPDVSYRYNGRPPITAYSIKMYIERMVGPLMNISEGSEPQPLSTIIPTVLSTCDEAKHKLAHRIKVPQSDLRYFDSYSQLIIACCILNLLLMMLMIVMMILMMIVLLVVVMVMVTYYSALKMQSLTYSYLYIYLHRFLSSDAACLCLIPDEGFECLPLHLRWVSL